LARKRSGIRICGAPDAFDAEMNGVDACCHSRVSKMVDELWNSTAMTIPFTEQEKSQISLEISNELALQCATNSMTEAELSVEIAQRISKRIHTI